MPDLTLAQILAGAIVALSLVLGTSNASDLAFAYVVALVGGDAVIRAGRSIGNPRANAPDPGP